MNLLKQKIKETTLFDAEDKINILAAIDTFPASDLSELERIIDEYDQKRNKIVGSFRDSMLKTLDSIVLNAKPEDRARIHAATDQIRLGFRTMIPD